MRSIRTYAFIETDSHPFRVVFCVQLTSPSKATDYEDENLYLGTPNGMRLFEVTDEDLMSKHYL